MAFLWVARQVDAPLLGINKIERVDEFVQALEHSLTEEEASYIAEPYKPQAIMYNLPAV